MNDTIEDVRRAFTMARDQYYRLEERIFRLEKEKEKHKDCYHTRKEYVNADPELYRLQQNLADIRAALGCSGQTQAVTMQTIRGQQTRRCEAIELVNKLTTQRSDALCILKK